AGIREGLAQALVERPMVEEAGERIRLRLMLEPRADLRVVQRKRGSITESLCELELVLVEERLLAEPVDVECALDRVARDQRNRDQRLRLVSRCARHRRRARIEVGLVYEDRLAMLDAPAGEPHPERATVGQD